MASQGAAAITLNLAAVAAVLALLVIPSLGRCPSLGPVPPPPGQAPPPPPESVPASPPAQAPPPPLEAIPPPPSVQAPPPSLMEIPPAPAPGPGLEPRLGCSECQQQCFPACHASHQMACKEECYNYKSRCEQCTTPEIEKCTARCTGSCDCNAEAQKSCAPECSYNTCNYCVYSRDKSCNNVCNNYCNNNCWGP
ncbi:hypothetical protein D1007_48230 [Hordeum vulgare]|uniref:Uncharacterized protein n=1 Tax=Hordeum vulgare subsp. vulgare TaxID=112509 RepID=A0A8I6YIF8_HORVV|nr:hypothetical protein D1007_48230 [Hordeum vulgare]